MGQAPWGGAPDIPQPRQPANGNGEGGNSTLVLIFIPVMVVILTVLLGLVVFLIAVLYMRRRKGIRLTEDGGPLDLSKGDGVIGEGGVEGVEARWLETVDPEVKEAYKRAKDWQLQYPPASVPTDITLSQFLSIQEKGVSAWAFEPDYEDNLSLYVQSRTEITFLADGPGMPAREGGGNSVMANLPLPKLNEVYYWEVKMYDKPPNTEVAIGLATKPYPSFRLPGWNKHSIAYFASDGFKSHNYPFTGSSYGPPLAEGDVLGVGYRPRTGTVFFTRNGRKMDDAYTGLQQLNLFPTVGANGPCTIHVNLGQSGFVFIEANVKKWGLAPMVGTLAPPPAYGSERGSILLDAGYGTPGANRNTANLGGVNALLEAARVRSAARLGTSAGSSTTSLHGRAVQMESPRTPNSSRRHRRAGRRADLAGSVPTVSSPLRASEAGPGPSTVGSRRRALGRAANDDGDGTTHISPTDTPSIEACVPSAGGMEYLDSADDGEDDDEDADFYDDALTSPARDRETSPIEHNPPTPNLLDISMHSLRNGGHYFGTHYAHDGESGDGNRSGESDETARPSRLTLGPARMSRTNSSPPPPGYAPLDPHVYASGLPGDLPEELVNQAIAAMSEGDQGSGSSATDPQTQNHEQNSNEGTRGALGWWGFGSGSRRG
ncbi:hypothetical protein IAR55_005375 [Kwoniella newhampshirensis]|uniref:B30.2/SPRY domain-containing protein n=1 Tax=Kwoniella newhampshirensis TaxID=1651941 RepID=A0AAW0YH83_9TREE